MLSLFTQDNSIPDPPLEGTNPLNEDSPDSLEDFVETLNTSVLDYNDRVTEYEEALMEVESTNIIGEQVVNLVMLIITTLTMVYTAHASYFTNANGLVPQFKNARRIDYS